MVTTSWVLCHARFHSRSRRGSGGWLPARLVCRLAKARALSGWVQNDAQDVEIFVRFGSEPGEISPRTQVALTKSSSVGGHRYPEGHATGTSRFFNPR